MTNGNCLHCLVLLPWISGVWYTHHPLTGNRCTVLCCACLQSPEEAEGLVAEVAAAHDQLMSRCSWGTFLSKKLGLEVYLRR
jgi:hypothetical protein